MMTHHGVAQPVRLHFPQPLWHSLRGEGPWPHVTLQESVLTERSSKECDLAAHRDRILQPFEKHCRNYQIQGGGGRLREIFAMGYFAAGLFRMQS